MTKVNKQDNEWKYISGLNTYYALVMKIYGINEKY